MHEYVRNTGQSPGQDSAVVGDLSMNDAETGRPIPGSAPWSWLEQGLRDVRSSRYLSLVYGMFFVLMGHGIERAHSSNPAISIALSVGFLFLGPFLAMGLYELSRQIQRNEKVDLLLSLFSWCRNPGAVGRYAFILSIVMVIWLSLSTRLVGAIDQGQGIGFFLALLAWAVLALMVFMASAVSIPMMLDQPVNAWPAISTSIRCCLSNHAALGLWAVIIVSGVGLSLLLDYWPLLLLGPVLGHATWRAYQACVKDNHR